MEHDADNVRASQSLGSVTREILRKYDISLKKRYGQNFLIDSNVPEAIVRAARITKDDAVLEIGPGIGTLTMYLARAAGAVCAVELDQKLIPVLNDALIGTDNVRVIRGDILKTDIAALADEMNAGRPFKVAANLPYYITTQILLTLLEKNLSVTKIVKMVQKEVAERMTAAPGSKIYGALSIAVQFRSQPRIAFDVSPTSFLPPPEVTSSVVICDVCKPPVEVDEEFFFKVVRTAFAQRRKTLLNSLACFGRERILASGIDGKRRAETLSLEEFAELCRYLKG
mgnify:CR=1 FL=1